MPNGNTHVGESKDSTLGAKLGALAIGAAVVTEGGGSSRGALDGSSTSADLGMEEEGGPVLGAKVTASQPHGTVRCGAN